MGKLLRLNLVHQKISIFLRLWASSRAIPPSPKRAIRLDLYHTHGSIDNFTLFQKQTPLPKMVSLYTLRDNDLAEDSKHERFS